MNSCIYRGVVRHRRFAPVPHRLRLPLFMVYLDLAELGHVFDKRWLWSTSRSAPARFQRRDYLGDPSVSLDTAVRDLVEQRTGERPPGAVRLLTNLRYFGYTMNPISLFFCHDDNDHIAAIVAEVHNTPWGERHCYVLQPGEESRAARKLRFGNAKEFHVSPFMGMDIDYRWTIARPGRRFSAHIENRQGENKLFDATLTLSRRPIEAVELNRLLVRYPFMTMQVALSIYLHAGLLWLKGVPFHSHPRKARLAGGKG